MQIRGTDLLASTFRSSQPAFSGLLLPAFRVLKLKPAAIYDAFRIGIG
ncbi:hypothetical protein HG15A2_31740 [Adhaeretor mobilis]|uniref:Uncharacterized protein n=1 Tax=Adhaeretor mobilis TaxID=1930276 RepID=A0A517MYB9_9BACT|nr:hypothetical protein HG15A2_31740 [Adhaeretor mobilis]